MRNLLSPAAVPCFLIDDFRLHLGRFLADSWQILSHGAISDVHRPPIVRIDLERLKYKDTDLLSVRSTTSLQSQNHKVNLTRSSLFESSPCHLPRQQTAHHPQCIATTSDNFTSHPPDSTLQNGFTDLSLTGFFPFPIIIIIRIASYDGHFQTVSI